MKMAKFLMRTFTCHSTFLYVMDEGQEKRPLAYLASFYLAAKEKFFNSSLQRGECNQRSFIEQKLRWVSVFTRNYQKVSTEY
jgi:hypothetical protein